MKIDYFRWEREAAIHLLFPTLEGSMEPFKKYVGFSFPTCILIFKNRVVTWCLKEDDFYEFGRKLRKIYEDPKKEKQMVVDLEKAIGKLADIEKTISHTNLSQVSDDKLLQLYQKLYETFLSSYAIGAISTPLYFETEYFLREEKGLSDKELNQLVATDKDSYSKKAEKYLLKTGDIKSFIDKYFWLDNNYSGTKILTPDEVKKRLAELQKKQVLENKKTGPPQNISPEVLRLAELLKHFSLYKDERKKNILIYLHFLEVLLKEVSKRSKLSLDDLRNIFPWEVKLALEGKLKSNQIQKRQKYCIVVWEEGKSMPEVLEGEKAKAWEDKTLTKTSKAVKIVKGNPASTGKTTGKVRVLLSAKDCSKLKDGEVLVTFMTSPDFMPAIRRAGAIITNLGGVTSHAAIISRELGIPCIVGTKVATQVLSNGDIVEVDANSGIVRILK